MVARFGKLDILVIGSDLDSAGNEFVIAALNAVNVNGVFRAMREASKVMTEGGLIISLSSGVASRVSGPGLTDYAATSSANKRLEPPPPALAGDAYYGRHSARQKADGNLPTLKQTSEHSGTRSNREVKTTF